MKLSGESIAWELVQTGALPERMLHDAQAAERSTTVAAMHFALDEITRPILGAVLDKATGSPSFAGNSLVQPDAYSLVYYDDAEQKEQRVELAELLTTFRELGTTAVFGRRFSKGPLGVINKYIIPQLGRDHRKIYTFDDVIYSFGGSNFIRKGLVETYDFLLRAESPQLASWLREHAISSSHHADAVEVAPLQLDGSNIVLSDSGRPFSSPIMKQAKWLLEHAEPGTIRFVSQYKPPTVMHRLMKHRDPRLVVYNHPEALGSWRTSLPQRIHEWLGEHLPNTVQPDRYVHAKAISVVLAPDEHRKLWPEGGPAIITGSHNFHLGGIAAGTKEIALLSRDSGLVADFNDWADRSFLSQEPDLSEAA